LLADFYDNSTVLLQRKNSIEDSKQVDVAVFQSNSDSKEKVAGHIWPKSSFADSSIHLKPCG
jgi:hypothetical protein